MSVDKSMRVLVVDDYKSMVRIIRGLVEQLGFQNVDDAIDALQEVLKAAKKAREEALDATTFVQVMRDKAKAGT